jgi:p-aminobenzoyl-glutamate transporter AbgT
MGAQNTAVRNLVTGNGSIWTLVVSRNPTMILFTINSHLYGSLNGNVKSAILTINEIRQVMEKIAEHYYFIDFITLHHVARWVHDCGLDIVNNQ